MLYFYDMTVMLRYWLYVMLIMGAMPVAFSQLDTIHWVPPMHSRDPGNVADHYLYLSTPSLTPVVVEITDGAGQAVGDSPYEIQNGEPAAILIANGQTSQGKLMVLQSELNSTLQGKGLRVSASAPIYCSARYRSLNQADIITCKGSTAAGKLFRLGGMPIAAIHDSRSFVFGIMAIEDNAHVLISGYDSDVVFAGIPEVTANQLDFTLNAGECRVYSVYAENEANLDGALGALIQSTGNLVVNVGNWCGSVGDQLGQDIGVDQIIPVGELGKDHVLVEGLGVPIQERGFVLAHYPNTEVFINGAIEPSATLQPGEWYMTDSLQYSGEPHGNMFLHTSNPAYVYQFLAGSSSQATPGLNFIPAISCGLPSFIDEIPAVNSIGSTAYDGGIFAITQADAVLEINGQIQSDASPIDGFDGWVTYRILGLVGDVSISSTGPVAAGLFGSSELAGFAGFHSGFSVNIAAAFSAPELVCWGDPASIVFTGDTIGSDQLFWNFGALDIQDEPDGTFTATAPAAGSYLVELTVDGSFCVETTSHSIEFLPFYSSNSEVESCGPFSWNGQILEESGSYAETLLSWTGCDSLVELELLVVDPPNVAIEDWVGDLTMQCPLPDARIPVMDCDPAYQQTWYFSPTGSSSIEPLFWDGQSIPYRGAGIYEVHYATGAPCSSEANGQLFVSESECSLIIPNVITPNLDGDNDSFQVLGLQHCESGSIQVFDRWGNLRFEQGDFHEAGEWIPQGDLSEGVYYYILEVVIPEIEIEIPTEIGQYPVQGPGTFRLRGTIHLFR